MKRPKMSALTDRIRAALYLRRSTEEHQAESLETQLASGKKFIEKMGWTLDPAHIFTDSGISRGEFKHRPGLIAVANAAEDGEFDVVITRDESRLGGDMHRVGLWTQDLADNGVRLFYYSTEEEVESDTPMARLINAIRNFAAELEREKISSRTREHLALKAGRGLNAGGKCYGYDNVRVEDGDKGHTDYAINPVQAANVLGAWKRYGSGEGLRTMIIDLTMRGVPGPGPNGTWSKAGLHAMLRNERYLGKNVWGVTHKTYRKGTKVRIKADPSMIETADRPDLRIIDEETAARVRLRIEAQAKRPESKGGRPPRFLLSGILRCGHCGGPLKVIDGKQGQTRIKVYVCSNYHAGKRVDLRQSPDITVAFSHSEPSPRCTNPLRRPVELVDAAVLEWVAANLGEDIILDVLKEVRRRLGTRVDKSKNEVAPLEKEMATTRAEVDRLVAALATTEDKPDAIVTGIQERQERLRTLEARMRAVLTAPEAIKTEVHRLEAEARHRLRDLRAQVTKSPAHARKVLATLFPKGISCEPVKLAEGKRFRLDGDAALGNMLTWEADPPTPASAGDTNLASPRGQPRDFHRRSRDRLPSSCATYVTLVPSRVRPASEGQGCELHSSVEFAQLGNSRTRPTQDSVAPQHVWCLRVVACQEAHDAQPLVGGM